MKKFYLILFCLIALAPLTTSAQTSREYIRNRIQYEGECRNVAITKYNGDLMLYGRNGWAAKSCPANLTNALHELNDEKQYIDDVQLTDGGRWFIIYGNNGCQWNDIPYSLERKVREFNNNRETITSVTFNDSGDWIVITDKHICASHSKIQDWIAEGMEEFGTVWTACITDDAVVVVYARGYNFLGEVPEDLKSALTRTNINVYRLKIAGSAWFFSDGKSRYSYNM